MKEMKARAKKWGHAGRGALLVTKPLDPPSFLSVWVLNTLQRITILVSVKVGSVKVRLGMGPWGDLIGLQPGSRKAYFIQSIKGLVCPQSPTSCQRQHSYPLFSLTKGWLRKSEWPPEGAATPQFFCKNWSSQAWWNRFPLFLREN
jgi:hypothetical protein